MEYNKERKDTIAVIYKIYNVPESLNYVYLSLIIYILLKQQKKSHIRKLKALASQKILVENMNKNTIFNVKFKL